MNSKLVYLLIFLWMLPLIPAEVTTVSDASELVKEIENIRPGDTIILQRGTYRVDLVLTNPGTQEKPITLKGQPGVVLTSKDKEVVNIQAPYWVIEDIEINGEKSTNALILVNNNQITIKNNKIHNNLESAISVKGKYSTIENNEIYNIDRLNAWFYHPLLFIVLSLFIILSYFVNKKLFLLIIIINVGGMVTLFLMGGFYVQNKDAHAIIVWPGSEEVIISNNSLYQLSGDGVQVINDFKNKGVPLAQKVTIDNNQIYAAREECIDIKTSQNILIENNECSNILPSQTSQGSGITLHAGPNKVKVANNVIFNTRTGISVTKGKVTSNLEEIPQNIEILNNTVLSLVSKGKGWASGSGIILGEASSILIKGNHIQDAKDFALGLTKEAKSEEITITENILQGQVALHLNKDYLKVKAENNRIDGLIEIQDTIQDIEVEGFEKSTITKKSKPNVVETYQNRGREIQLKWLQIIWLISIVMSLIVYLINNYRVTTKNFISL